MAEVKKVMFLALFSLKIFRLFQISTLSRPMLSSSRRRTFRIKVFGSAEVYFSSFFAVAITLVNVIFPLRTLTLGPILVRIQSDTSKPATFVYSNLTLHTVRIENTYSFS